MLDCHYLIYFALVSPCKNYHNYRLIIGVLRYSDNYVVHVYNTYNVWWTKMAEC
jgi:hypothetical protein